MIFGICLSGIVFIEMHFKKSEIFIDLQYYGSYFLFHVNVHISLY
jgi:hypothetical protein